MTTVSLREWPDNPANRAVLKRIFDEAPDYVRRADPDADTATAVVEFFQARPPNRPDAPKQALAIMAGERVIGCIDLIHDWPQPGTTHIGLLLLAERWQGVGIGRQAVSLLRQYLKQVRQPNRLRLGVLETNRDAGRFWYRQGFEPTGETKPYQRGTLDTEVRIYEAVG